ncbi:MAG: hypothetical protein F6K24_26785 [Okeania sp. SIO2D1]|nr:hypothetical protein [Okeania sp. SIO2D1]
MVRELVMDNSPPVSPMVIPVRELSKLMVSASGVAFAMAIASGRLPLPESMVLVTLKGAIRLEFPVYFA